MVETVRFDQMHPNCDPELEDSKPIFLHDTLASLVTKGLATEEIQSRWTFTGIHLSQLFHFPNQPFAVTH